jgi:lipopolysaccharide/colanic/teichoic acid biosynthesis glycosyltransferase
MCESSTFSEKSHSFTCQSGAKKLGRLHRIFDGLFALSVLIALAPFLILLAAAIVFDSGLPIFFRQSRVGQNGQLFSILKFRTMRAATTGPAITVGGDSRVTRVGRLLRKLKLDEIPQMWNVARGEMALVGPRPEVPQYVDLNNPLWRSVLQVPPGITDPASILYRNEEAILAKAENPIEFYEKTLLPTKLVLNLSYLEQRTFASDVRIILQTIRCAMWPETNN